MGGIALILATVFIIASIIYCVWIYKELDHDILAMYFLWKVRIRVLPLILIDIIILVKICKHNRDWFILLCISAVCAVLLVVLYNLFFKRFVQTPRHMAKTVESYDEYYDRCGHGDDNYKDYVREYVGFKVQHVLKKAGRWISTEKGELKYITAFMNRHMKELPHVVGWKYISEEESASLKNKAEQASEEELKGIKTKTDQVRHQQVYSKIARYYVKEFDHPWAEDHRCFSDSIALDYAGSEISSTILIFWDDGTMDATNTYFSLSVNKRLRKRLFYNYSQSTTPTYRSRSL